MKIIAAAIAAVAFAAAAANADVLKVYDEAGAAKEIDTAKMSGCTLVFDSAGQPFEICKMERVEMRAHGSTRTRPGGEAKAAELQVVYKRTE